MTYMDEAVEAARKASGFDVLVTDRLRIALEAAEPAIAEHVRSKVEAELRAAAAETEEQKVRRPFIDEGFAPATTLDALHGSSLRRQP